jgi:hypothetical protein
MVLVDPAEHIIRKVQYQGASSAIEHGLMNSLCAILVDIPIQEASDHASIYLEHKLRDHSLKPPVTGITMPENADPMFQTPVQLTRKLLVEYREVTNYTSTENSYDQRPSPAWLTLSMDEKLNKLQTVLRALCSDLQLQESDVEIVGIDYDVRITVRFHSRFTSVTKQNYLMQLENGFKQKIEERLELYTEEMKDLSTIRRL